MVPYDRSTRSGAPAEITPTGAADVVVESRLRTGRTWHRGWWAELWRWAIVGIVFAVLAPTLFAASLIAAIYWQARSDQSRPVDAIVVMGAAQFNGTPSSVLQSRLDTALDAYRAGYAPYIVVTGGKQTGDQYTEAETGRNYLEAHGVPENAILLENSGRDSWQSMQGVAVLLQKRKLSRVLIVSDGFHLFRVKAMARRLGLTPFGKPDTRSPIKRNSRLEFNYVIREAGGVVAFLVTD